MCPEQLDHHPDLSPPWKEFLRVMADGKLWYFSLMIKHTVERARKQTSKQATLLDLNLRTDIIQSHKQGPNECIIIHNFFTVDIKNLEGDSLLMVKDNKSSFLPLKHRTGIPWRSKWPNKWMVHIFFSYFFLRYREFGKKFPSYLIKIWRLIWWKMA